MPRNFSRWGGIIARASGPRRPDCQRAGRRHWQLAGRTVHWPWVWRKYPLRQEKSWKGEWKCSLKPFEAAQRVRLPPGRGAARQPEASLAWATVTSLVKRRQWKLKPCVSLEIGYPLRPSVLG